MSAQKILVVDDNPVVVKSVEIKLGGAGYKVFTATDGSGAIGVARREKPDLIVLDISFPPDVGMPWDGFLIMQWLRRLEETKDTPIIIITGEDPTKHRDKAIGMGAVAFFTKPVDNDGLIDVIRQTLAGTVAPQK